MVANRKFFLLYILVFYAFLNLAKSDDDIDDDTDYYPPSNYSQPYDCTNFNENLTKCTCRLDLINCVGQQIEFHPESINLTHAESILTQNLTKTHHLSLVFANNLIKELKPIIIIGNMTKIKMINLAQNQISKIDDGLFRQIESDVETIDLSENQLTSFNTQYNFTQLKILKLDKQESKFKIDENLFVNTRFSNLISLDLRSNQLNINGSVFKSLNNLKKLQLDSNNLDFDSICSAISSIKSLETLTLNENSFKNVKSNGYECFKNLNMLTTLELNKCSLDEKTLMNMLLPSSSEETSPLVETLQIIELKNNNLKSLPYTVLVSLKKLVSLKITIDEETFSVYESRVDITRQFENLIELDLSGSNVKSIPKNAFLAFKNLKNLILSNTHLTNIDYDAFNGLDKLDYLDLSYNNLQSFNSSFNFTQLNGNFNIQSNNFTCDCSLKWLFSIKIHSSYRLNLKCKFNLRMLNINEQDFDLLSCDIPIAKPKPIRAYLWGGFMLTVLIVGIVGGILYLRHQHVQNRNRQYRYRFFSERLQEDAFDGMIDVPVYRDTTVSLQLKDSDANLLNSQHDANTSSRYSDNPNNSSRDLNV